MVMPPLVSRSSSDSSLVALLSIALLILCSPKVIVCESSINVPHYISGSRTEGKMHSQTPI
jgi:hypothetical protein